MAQNTPLLQMDYFRLIIFKKQQTQRSSESWERNWHLLRDLHLEGGSSSLYQQEEEEAQISRNWNPFSKVKWNEVAQSCPALCDPMDCSLLGSSVHGIFQTRVLEWVAISFSRGSSRPRDWTRVSHIVDKRFTVWTTREVQGFKSALQPCLCSLCLSRALLPLAAPLQHLLISGDNI